VRFRAPLQLLVLLLNVIEMIVLHKTSLLWRFDDFHRPFIFSLFQTKKN
jgi:hypothetical protein